LPPTFEKEKKKKNFHSGVNSYAVKRARKKLKGGNSLSILKRGETLNGKAPSTRNGGHQDWEAKEGEQAGAGSSCFLGESRAEVDRKERDLYYSIIKVKKGNLRKIIARQDQKRSGRRNAPTEGDRSGGGD